MDFRRSEAPTKVEHDVSTRWVVGCCGARSFTVVFLPLPRWRSEFMLLPEKRPGDARPDRIVFGWGVEGNAALADFTPRFSIA